MERGTDWFNLTTFSSLLWHSLVKQVVDEVPVEGRLAGVFASTHENDGTAIEIPCGFKD